MRGQTTLLALVVALALFSGCNQEGYLVESTVPTAEQTPELDFRKAFPDLIALPDGFQPEGIVAGTGNDFYVGSLAGGAIYRGDFRKGTGSVFFPAGELGVAVGLAFDNKTKYLYVAGGPTGNASVIDTRTGELVAQFSLGDGFINDVIVTQDAAYFTNSFVPNLYKIPLSANGQPIGPVEVLPMGADFVSVNGFNANGIEAAANGQDLIVVNSSTGTLYRVDPATGTATPIDLGGDTVVAGDGILLLGKTLYVVQNQFNQIATVTLSNNFLSGTLTGVLTDPDFDVPTTVTRKGSTLYAVNARFGTPATPETEYDVVRVD